MKFLSEDEKEAVEDFARGMVTVVLSNCRFTKATEGQKWRFFEQYTSPVTDEQVRAFKSSPLWESLKDLLRSREARADSTDDLSHVLNFFEQVCIATKSPYRLLADLEKDGKPRLDDIEVLRKVKFITPGAPIGPDKFWEIDYHELAQWLGIYIDFGIVWEQFERTVLTLCVKYRRDHMGKAEPKKFAELIGDWCTENDWPIWISVTIAVGAGLVAWALPRIIGFGIGAAVLVYIALWSTAHLHTDQPPYVALAGYGFVAGCVVAWAVEIGTREIRERLDTFNPPRKTDKYGNAIGPVQDLVVLDLALHGHRTGHNNLHYTRDMVAKCITQQVGLPVQLLTLLGRSISAGKHYW